MSKVFFIRHGYALHNDLYWSIGNEAYSKYQDTPLLHKGYLQAAECREKYINNGDALKNMDIVLVSPLSRTISTALSIFGSNSFYSTKFIALDCLMEYPQGGEELCNKRKTVDILKNNYPIINYSQINQDTEWRQEQESIQELDERIHQRLDFIKSRPEKKIAIVSHSSFLKRYLYKNIGDEHNELQHCHPFGPYKL